MTNQERKKAAQELPPELWDLYNSLELGRFIKAHSQKLNLADNTSLINCIGDTILGFYHTKDLPQLLQKEVGASADEAQQIVRELTEFLTPVLEREAGAMSEKQADLKNLSEQMTQPDEAESDTQATEEVEQHEVLPMRTMKGDIQRIHGYGAYREQFPTEASAETDEPVVKSSQDEILKKQPLAETPKMAE